MGLRWHALNIRNIEQIIQIPKLVDCYRLVLVAPNRDERVIILSPPNNGCPWTKTLIEIDEFIKTRLTPEEFVYPLEKTLTTAG
jgi:hypothetical protein